MNNKTQVKSAWSKHPDYKIDISESDCRIRIIINGKTIADSKLVLIVREQDHSAVSYFPREDVNMNFLTTIDKITFCPFKGNAKHWSLQINDQYIEVAAWSYENPFPEVSHIKNYVAFYAEVLSTSEAP